MGTQQNNRDGETIYNDGRRWPILEHDGHKLLNEIKINMTFCGALGYKLETTVFSSTFVSLLFLRSLDLVEVERQEFIIHWR